MGRVLTVPLRFTLPPAAFTSKVTLGANKLPSITPSTVTGPSFLAVAAPIPANLSNRVAFLALSLRVSFLAVGTNASPSTCPDKLAVAPAPFRLILIFGANKEPSMRPSTVTGPKSLSAGRVVLPANRSTLATSAALALKVSADALGTPPSPSRVPAADSFVPATWAMLKRRISSLPL